MVDTVPLLSPIKLLLARGTFRYTGFDEFFFWDRNYEFKARLWEEELYLPAVAVGIRDVIGTGVFGSEYLVLQRL